MRIGTLLIRKNNGMIFWVTKLDNNRIILSLLGSDKIEVEVTRDALEDHFNLA